MDNKNKKASRAYFVRKTQEGTFLAIILLIPMSLFASAWFVLPMVLLGVGYSVLCLEIEETQYPTPADRMRHDVTGEIASLIAQACRVESVEVLWTGLREEDRSLMDGAGKGYRIVRGRALLRHGPTGAPMAVVFVIWEDFSGNPKPIWMARTKCLVDTVNALPDMERMEADLE